MNDMNEKLEQMQADVKRQYEVINAAMRAEHEAACERGDEYAFGVAATLWCLNHSSNNQQYFFEALTLAATIHEAAEEIEQKEAE